jgi:FkbM family methyltransferase
MNLVQIGTNTANDDFFFNVVSKIEKEKINNLILVEPLSSLNDSIASAYINYNYVLENCVINTDSLIKEEVFYISRYHWLSSLKKEHIDKHKTNEIPVEIRVKAMTVNELFDKHNLLDIDVLFIDCEGTDDLVIKSLDFVKYNVKKIYYEHVHIDNEPLVLFLQEKGYEVSKCNFSDGLTSMAIKK